MWEHSPTKEIMQKIRIFAIVAVFGIATGGMVSLAKLSVQTQKLSPAVQPVPRRVVLTDVQARMIQSLDQEIEQLPEVKQRRAQQRGIMAGIATSAGMTAWTWKVEKDKVVIEEAPTPEPSTAGTTEKEPNPKETKP